MSYTYVVEHTLILWKIMHYKTVHIRRSKTFVGHGRIPRSTMCDKRKDGDTLMDIQNFTKSEWLSRTRTPTNYIDIPSETMENVSAQDKT